MTLLSETAHELTHQHKRRTVTDDGPVWGDEPALLDILASCVASNSGSGSASGVARTGSPVDLGALDLWSEITETIDTNWPGRGNPSYVRVSYAHKLTAWVNTTLEPVAEESLHVLVQAWAYRIREHIEPTKKVPLAGVTCPTCGWDRTVTEDEAGEYTYRPALLAYPESVPVTIVCTVETCSGEWSGPEVVDTFMKPLVTGRTTV